MNGIIGAVPDDVPIEMYLERHDDDDTFDPARPASPAGGALGRPPRRDFAGRSDRKPGLVTVVRVGDPGGDGAQARANTPAR